MSQVSIIIVVRGRAVPVEPTQSLHITESRSEEVKIFLSEKGP